jgi:hypothetical protein
MASRRSGSFVVSLATISVRVLYTTYSLMLANIARLSARVQPIFSLSLEVAGCTTMSLGIDVEGIFVHNPLCGNFLPGPKKRVKGAFMFDLDWMLIVIQSTFFPSTTSAYTIRKIERQHSLHSRKGFS